MHQMIHKACKNLQGGTRLITCTIVASFKAIYLRKNLTQRISSGLYSERHFKVFFSIFVAFFTSQFLAIRYLATEASEQYSADFPDSCPRSLLTLPI